MAFGTSVGDRIDASRLSAALAQFARGARCERMTNVARPGRTGSSLAWSADGLLNRILSHGRGYQTTRGGCARRQPMLRSVSTGAARLAPNTGPLPHHA